MLLVLFLVEDGPVHKAGSKNFELQQNLSLVTPLSLPDSLWLRPTAEPTAAALRTSGRWTTGCRRRPPPPPWKPPTPRRPGVSAAHKWNGLWTTDSLTLNNRPPHQWHTAARHSHQRGWPFWPSQTSRTLCAGRRGTRSAPEDLPAAASKDKRWLKVEATEWQDGECFRPHLKVAGMKHVSNDDNFFVPLPQFSLLLRPPVQLSAQTKTQTSRRNDEGVLIWWREEKWTQPDAIWKQLQFKLQWVLIFGDFEEETLTSSGYILKFKTYFFCPLKPLSNFLILCRLNAGWLNRKQISPLSHWPKPAGVSHLLACCIFHLCVSADVVVLGLRERSVT